MTLYEINVMGVHMRVPSTVPMHLFQRGMGIRVHRGHLGKPEQRKGYYGYQPKCTVPIMNHLHGHDLVGGDLDQNSSDVAPW